MESHSVKSGVLFSIMLLTSKNSTDNHSGVNERKNILKYAKNDIVDTPLPRFSSKYLYRFILEWIDHTLIAQ